MSDRLRETFRRAADGEPAAGESWVAFQQRLARATRWRNISVAVAGVAAATALALVLPGSNSGDRDTLTIGPSQPGREPVRRYTDPRAGFTLLYPAAWDGGGSPAALAHFRPFETPVHEAEDDFEPYGLAALWDPGREGFAVQVDVYRAADPIRGQGPMVERRDVWAEHGATVTESAAKVGEELIPLYRVDFPAEPVDPETRESLGNDPTVAGVWCARCTVELATMDLGDGWTIEMRLLGPTEDYDSYRSFGLRILETIQRVPRAPDPS